MIIPYCSDNATVQRYNLAVIQDTISKACWAIMEFIPEPGPWGSKDTFSSTVPVRYILTQYQHQVAQALPLVAHHFLENGIFDFDFCLLFGKSYRFLSAFSYGIMSTYNLCQSKITHFQGGRFYAYDGEARCRHPAQWRQDLGTRI